jgi:hypothetical protein
MVPPRQAQRYPTAIARQTPHSTLSDQRHPPGTASRTAADQPNGSVVAPRVVCAPAIGGQRRLQGIAKRIPRAAETGAFP